MTIQGNAETDRRESLLQVLEAAEEKAKAIPMKGQPLLVFGTGNTTELYQNAFAAEHLQVAAYTDNNKAKWGTQYHGIDVIPPTEIKERYPDAAVIICVGSYGAGVAITQQLDEMGLSSLLVDAYIFGLHKNEILACFDALDDETSRDVYSTLITKRMRNIPVDAFERNQYFALNEFAGAKPGEVFVDAGAYTGDSVERYLWEREGVFGKIYAFEPYTPNLASMEHRFRRLMDEWNIPTSKIVVEHAGIGDTSAMMNVCVRGGDNAGYGANLSTGDAVETIPVHALDDYFADQSIGFLKADIESMELAALRGAVNVIKRDHPRLAICIYHNASDMYQIQTFLMQLDLGYHFAIRHHSPTYSETVLYAW